MLLHFTTKDFRKLFPTLLRLWPETGTKWSRKNAAALLSLIKEKGKEKTAAADSSTIVVSTSISKEQLLEHGRRVVAISYSTPFRFRRLDAPAKTLNSKAIKVRPGSDLSIAIEGNPTTARIETIRRIRFRGKPNYVKAGLIINTENIPFYLQRETKCDCRYCGNPAPRDSEITSCPSCGAVLPSCV